MTKITPFLWFDTQAQDAAAFYVSIFPNSNITLVARRTEAAPENASDVLTVTFELDGHECTALNGGAGKMFTEAVSLVVYCRTQDQIDHYWSRLSADGGKPDICGWLKDKFGVSWQVMPEALPQWLAGPDLARASRVMAAVMDMTKLDLKTLEEA
jgi:predicted 3-demethylubiquinone-9 3-methyltransferase (glyoxalase superfamily)